MAKALFRRPGLYRAVDVIDEIATELGIKMNHARFYYLRHLGIIPPGELRVPARRGPAHNQAWSQQQLDEIIGALRKMPVTRTEGG